MISCSSSIINIFLIVSYLFLHMGIVYHGSKRARLLLLFLGVWFWCGRLSQVCFRICARCLRRSGRQDSGILISFCLLLIPRVTISVGSIDKIQAFCSVLSTFASARTDFGRLGRQDSDILIGFCLLLPPRAPISVGSVDKIQIF